MSARFKARPSLLQALLVFQALFLHHRPLVWETFCEQSHSFIKSIGQGLREIDHALHPLPLLYKGHDRRIDLIGGNNMAAIHLAQAQ